MAVQVLLSTMNQVSMDIFEKCRVHSNCLIINQCERNDFTEKEFEFGKVRMISTTRRGLSRSRNMALREAEGPICVLCDDDIIYRDGYELIIENAFKEIPQADIIVFNIFSLNENARAQENQFRSVKRIPKFKAYSSVHIAFRIDKVKDAELSFNERFGSGSGMYSMAEDSLFFDDAHKKKLKAYTYPATIADLKTEGSTWFIGFNEKYFYDTGAYLAASYPVLKYLFCFYYPLRLRNRASLDFLSALKQIFNGMDGYEKGLSYNDYKGT